MLHIYPYIIIWLSSNFYHIFYISSLYLKIYTYCVNKHTYVLPPTVLPSYMIPTASHAGLEIHKVSTKYL